MASYKECATLPHSSAITCVTFSYWDNTAGPLTKCIWIPPSTTAPEPANIKLLTRLTLKTEVTRDASLSDIDCNMYSLPELSACAVRYLFGATSRLKLGKTIYCITFIYKQEYRSAYLQWSNILDGAIKQDIYEYKVLLHKVRFNTDEILDFGFCKCLYMYVSAFGYILVLLTGLKN